MSFTPKTQLLHPKTHFTLEFNPQTIKIVARRDSNFIYTPTRFHLDKLDNKFRTILKLLKYSVAVFIHKKNFFIMPQRLFCLLCFKRNHSITR